MEKLTKEEIKQELEKSREEMQERVIERILEEVEHYSNKAILTSYKTSPRERMLFGKLVNIINNINNWL